jgi:hypothetical protein
MQSIANWKTTLGIPGQGDFQQQTNKQAGQQKASKPSELPKIEHIRQQNPYTRAYQEATYHQHSRLPNH